jgi:serine/threonine-protein kinase
MGEPKPSITNTPSVAPPNSGPQADPLLGRTINDRFQVLSLIARGGMGKVYKAEQTALGRLVALKVLHPNYNGEHDPEFHKRFFLEASTSSKLRHPNTVTVFDYGSTPDGIYYMAMELLEGRTLHRVLREVGKLPYDRALRITKQMCRSLREAHGIGVIHRDLKPANVFLVRNEDDEDFVKVLDFGLVKQLDDAGTDHLTQTGLFMGSPKYMAPEQIRGERVTAATDVYALGVVLFEMLTGKVPFDRGNSVNTLMAHVSDPVPAIHEFAPDAIVPVGVADLVYKCLQKDPQNRYSTMDALLDAIKLSTSGLMNSSLGSTGDYAQLSSSALSSLVDQSTARTASNGSSDHPTAAGAMIGLRQSSGDSAASTASTASAASAASASLPPLSIGAEQSGSSPLSFDDPSAAVRSTSMPVAQKSKAPMVLALLGVVGVMAAGGWSIKNRFTSTADTPHTTRPALSPEQHSHNNGAQQTTGTTLQVGNQQPLTPPPVEPTVHIMLDSEPSNVEVFEGTQSLGRTPLDLRWTGERGNPAMMHDFTFRLSGYLDAHITLGGAEIRYSARMNRRPRPVPQNQNGHTLPTGYREW